MKISVLALYKTSEAYLKEGISLYSERISHYINFEYEELNIKISQLQKDDIKRILQIESFALIKKLTSSDYIILLDEKGEMMSSVKFADFLRNKFVSLSKNMVFLIGGPYGFSQDIKDRCDFVLSLSPMTFTHQMVRLIFLEQLYRALTIIKGESYHH